MFAFLILLLQQVMAILGFQSKNKANPRHKANPKPEPGIDLEPGLHAGLRHRIQPFTIEIHQFQ